VHDIGNGVYFLFFIFIFFLICLCDIFVLREYYFPGSSPNITNLWFLDDNDKCYLSEVFDTHNRDLALYLYVWWIKSDFKKILLSLLSKNFVTLIMHL
jgi:hypothetical protein